MIGIVLAGGEGRRLRPLTYYIPKPMIPIGRSERPLLEFILLWMRRWKIREAYILVGYRWRQIANYFRDGRDFEMEIKYVVDKSPYGGTGGALRRLIDLGLVSGGTALVWYGDIVAPVDIGSMFSEHKGSGADITLAVSSSYRIPVGVVRLGGDGEVLGFEEKPSLNVVSYIGIMMMEINNIVRLLDDSMLGYEFDIAGDLIPAAIRSGMKVRAYIHEGPWYDVGSMESYEKLDHEMIEKIMGAEEMVPRYSYE